VIAGLPDLLERARRGRAAVGAFTCYDAETATAVLRAAGRRPVVLLVPAATVTRPGGDLLVAALRAMADRAPAPACVQLDHAHDLESVLAAIECGVGAVMADGSHLPNDANRDFVLSARSVAAPRGVAVEAALGRLAGDEDVAFSVEPGRLTDRAEAGWLARETGADCLAVAVGNVHGNYASEPQLDLARLASLAATVKAPLVLHGASGLPSETLAHAVAAGVAKVNFNTSLREAYLARTEAELPHVRDGSKLIALHGAQTDAVRDVAVQKLLSLSGSSG
jgi:ketose-bisphosphate aldolase